MKKYFKIKLLSVLVTALLPVAAGAADGAGGKDLSIEQRQAQRAQWCTDNPARCQDMQAKMVQRRAAHQAQFAQRFKQADSNGNGAIDRAEAEKSLPRLARHFDQVDANKDGQVTAEELAAARKQFDRGHFAQRFRQADTDGDGAITRAEAEKALPHLARQFDRVDANHDGRVTIAEIAAARKAVMTAHFEQRFKRADTDGDGRISRTEAEQAMPRLARHFDRIDANQDGVVTFEELAAARKAFFEQRRGRGHGRGEPTQL